MKPNRFYTADTHLCHANIIKYCHRPFKSVEEMDETLVKNWNSIVKPNDEIYHLGDVIFSKNLDILKRLNGLKYLIVGNHDYNVLTKLKDYFFIIDEQILVDNDNKLVLCHYPIHEWPFKNKGYKHIHGHSHGALEYNINALDVGVDATNYYPVSLEYIKSKLKSN